MHGISPYYEFCLSFTLMVEPDAKNIILYHHVTSLFISNLL